MLFNVPFQSTILPLSRTCDDKVETGEVVSGLNEAGVLSVLKLKEAFVLNVVLLEKTGLGMANVLTVKPDTEARLVPLNGLTNSGGSPRVYCKF